MPTTINPYWPLNEEDMRSPDIVARIINSFQYDPSSDQEYDPRFIQGVINDYQSQTSKNYGDIPQNQSWSGSKSPNATSSDYNQETGYIKGTPGDLAVLSGRMKPYTPSGQQPQPTAQGPVMQPPSVPSDLDTLSGYEDYMKIFKNTLGATPELDKKRRNQLAIVAGINALGQALKQVVDFHGRSKHGAPINAQQDRLTPALLSMYDKEMQDYQQRKDRYDLQKTNTMQHALQYAYGDEKYRDQYDKQLDLLNRQQTFSKSESDKEIAARGKLAEKQSALLSQKEQDQHVRDLEKLKKNYEYESRLIGQKANDAFNLVKEKYGAQQATKSAIELAKKSIQVMDEDPNKPIIIPPQIYLDVLQKQIALQNQDFTEFLTSTDFNATNNAGDIMVARYWKDFYKPVYDEQGNVVSWESKSALQPSSTQGADEMPSIFIPKTE